MKNYTVIYRPARNASEEIWASKWMSKKAAADSARGNGFRVIAVLSDKEIETIKATDEFDLMLDGKYSDLVINVVQQTL
ncbi:MAG: hypothetical protein FWG30_11630 [Eubacteriaceae bacterium]|nr:hypothetical protein [Eubacteriaceae bacterium]